MKKSIETRLPICCATTHYLTGETIFITRGEMGYHPSNPVSWLDGCVSHQPMSAKKWNEKYNITDAQYNAMVVGSMFGWDVPGVESALDVGN